MSPHSEAAVAALPMPARILRELAMLKRLALSANRAGGGWVSRTVLADIIRARGQVNEMEAALREMEALGHVESMPFQHGHVWRATASGIAVDRAAP